MEFAALIRKGKTGPARVRLHNYLQQHPNDAQATFLFGLSYHTEKKYGEAVTRFQEALKLDPEFHLTNYFHAWAEYYLGNLPDARMAFAEYLKFQPDHADTLFGLGLIDLDEDNLEEAESFFHRSLDVLAAQGKDADPKDIAKSRTRLGEVYERRGDLEKAKTELTAATDSYPDNYEGLYKLYRVLEQLGQTEQATKVHAAYVAAKERLHPGSSLSNDR